MIAYCFHHEDGHIYQLAGSRDYPEVLRLTDPSYDAHWVRVLDPPAGVLARLSEAVGEVRR